MQLIECSNSVSTHPLDALWVGLHAAEAALAASSQDDLGALEEQFQREAALQLKKRLQSSAQAKADATPPHCPKCGRKLCK
jgi:hypothetical protein